MPGPQVPVATLRRRPRERLRMTQGRCGSLLHIRMTLSFTTPRRFNRRTRSTRMNIKYIGMDIYKATISIAVMNGEGKVGMEAIIETKSRTILQCIQGIHGDLHVTLG